MHDRSGERQVSSEGLASRLKYSKDGGQVFYLLAEAGAQRSSELWALDVASGRGRPIIQGFSVIDYDVSEDGRTIVFGSKPPTGSREIWLAQADHSGAPQRLTASERTPLLRDRRAHLLPRIGRAEQLSLRNGTRWQAPEKGAGRAHHQSEWALR